MNLKTKYIFYLLGYYSSINLKAFESGLMIYILKDIKYKKQISIDNLYSKISTFAKDFNHKVPLTLEQFKQQIKI